MLRHPENSSLDNNPNTQKKKQLKTKTSTLIQPSSATHSSKTQMSTSETPEERSNQFLNEDMRRHMRKFLKMSKGLPGIAAFSVTGFFVYQALEQLNRIKNFDKKMEDSSSDIVNSELIGKRKDAEIQYWKKLALGMTTLSGSFLFF